MQQTKKMNFDLEKTWSGMEESEVKTKNLRNYTALGLGWLKFI